jgi:hypothetical protein
MNRKLKALGLSLVAVFALSAMMAVAASAAEFKSEVSHTSLSGSQLGTDVFTTNAGTVKCNEATYAGTSAEQNSTKASVTPTYTECTAFGFVNTKIDTNGCEYQFTTGSPNSVHIVCPAGQSIVVTAFNCEVTVPAQTISGGITFDNEGSGKTMDVRVTVSLTGITYIQHSKSFPGCKTEGTAGAGATSLFHDGTYTGEATVTATNTAGEHVSITVE